MPDPSPTKTRRSRITIAMNALAIVVCLVLAAMRLIGEAWWPVALLFFAPRWIWLAPWLIVMFAALMHRKASVIPMGLAVLVVIVGPIMNPNMASPQSLRLRDQAKGPLIRIMTFNRWNRSIDTAPLVEFIEAEDIDLICFQEGEPDSRLERFFRTHGWRVDPTRRVASRCEILEILPPSGIRDAYPDLWPTNITRVRLRHPSGQEFIAASIHVPSMRHAFHKLIKADIKGLQDQIAWRRDQIRQVAQILKSSAPTPIIAAGDFNTPADSPTLNPVRKIFQFAFEQAGQGYGWTWPNPMPYLRLEHIIASPGWKFAHSWVGPDLGSDHRPLIADVYLPVYFGD